MKWLRVDELYCFYAAMKIRRAIKVDHGWSMMLDINGDCVHLVTVPNVQPASSRRSRKCV